MPKIALCMIVKPDDREAELLDRCLGGIQGEWKSAVNVENTDGLAKHVDGIFLTITGQNQKCEEIAGKYGAQVSHFDWIGDFAAARNFNLSQVPPEYDYFVWTDCDDVWRNPHMIRDMLTKLQTEAIDAVTLFYFYDFDEYGQCVVKHKKNRILKNDGCVKWVGELHEDFEATRQILQFTNKDMEVLHLTDAQRIESAKHRNTEIAAAALAQNRQDPRKYWNLANAYMVESRFSDAIPVYLDFLGNSTSEEERFVAWHRLAAAYSGIGDNNRALQAELEAFSLRPWYPDAYFGLGGIYHKLGMLKNALEVLEIGFTKEPAENSMIVWNPRDYDYNPRMLLAQVYLELHKPREALANLKKAKKIYPKMERLKKLEKMLLPDIRKFDIAENVYKKAQKAKSKEAIKKLLDSVPKDMRYHPAIVNLRNIHFVKQESSGKDVVIYCGYTTGEWNPVIAKQRGVGGSEEAVIQLARRWVKLGWNVSVYANIGPRELFLDGVKWMPFMAWNYRDKQDIVILWRHPKPLDYEINASKVFVDMHDVISPQEFNASRISKLTKVMFKSRAHRGLYTNIPDTHATVVPHGLDISQFEKRSTEVQRNPYKILNTSSPDRGLLTNLEIIERVHAALPDELKDKLKFRWNYGFRVWDSEWKDNDLMVQWKAKAMNKLEELKAKGIVEQESGDMISQDKIVDQYLESGLLLYPSEFFEIGFISGMKGALAGAIPVVTDVFAQGEFLYDGILVHSDVNYNNWVVDVESGLDYGVKKEEQKQFVVDKIVEYFKNPEAFEPMRKQIQERIKEFTWDRTAQEWHILFNDHQPVQEVGGENSEGGQQVLPEGPAPAPDA